MNIIQYIFIKVNYIQGLSSVMILKLPTNTGVEYSAESKPMNGRLQIIGSANGQFSKTDYSPNMKIGDFYVFLMICVTAYTHSILQRNKKNISL